VIFRSDAGGSVIKRAAKKPKKKIKELWYADLLPEDHDPDFEEEYTQELENDLY
jgi:hypothetical protein